MPYPRPTLAEIDRRLIADIESRLKGTDPLLVYSYLGALARGVAGGQHELWGSLAWIADQIFDDTADAENVLRRAAEWGIEPIPATVATGTIAVTGTTGTAIPKGTVWQAGARVQYRSTAAAAIAAGAADVAVQAVAAGAAGNAADGTKVSLVAPIAGVVSEAAASGAIAGGADRESVDSVLRRLLLRRRTPPKGGAEDDYVLWALAAHADVTRAWCRPLGANAASNPVKAGTLGTVVVYFMTDDATATGIPSAATLATVKTYLIADNRRPVTARVFVNAQGEDAQGNAVEPLTASPVDLTINALTPDTPAVRAAIEAEIADLLRREGEPGGTILASHVREAISTAEGEADHEITLIEGASPADIVYAANVIPVPGVITWTGN